MGYRPEDQSGETILRNFQRILFIPVAAGVGVLTSVCLGCLVGDKLTMSDLTFWIWSNLAISSLLWLYFNYNDQP